MSGFAVIYDRSNTPVDPDVLDRVLKRLDHRGPDGQGNWFSGPVAMGHLHFWTTPEEVGEKQPLKLANFPYTIVMDGRLDNRSDIIRRLNLHPGEAGHLSDAGLLLHAYSRWSTDCFKDLIGEFAVAIWDPQVGELVCARDAVGDRTLFYSLQGTRMLIASEPWAVAAGLEKQVELDEREIAYHFALRAPEDGQTLFKDIYELLPGHWMKIGSLNNQHQFYWQPNLEKRTPRRSDVEYVEEFQEVLDESVRCRLRAINPPAVMMSGGLDSTSVACIAAKMLSPAPLTTVSYVFDEFQDCDERQYINAVRDQHGIRSIQIPCDDLWPFKNWTDWPLDPNWPPANPYRLILERTYSHARDEGISVMLTGLYGDDLYNRAENWLADLFLDGHLGQMVKEINFLINKYGLLKTLKQGTFQQTLKQVLKRFPGVEKIHRNSTAPRWLTPLSAGLLREKPSNTTANKQTEWSKFVGTGTNAREIYNTNRYGLELRTPYHDRRLVEFILQLPGYLLFSMGMNRRILRLAMGETWPGIIKSRFGKTNLLSLYNFGVERAKSDNKDWNHEDAYWRKYVKADVVLNEWQTEVSSQTDGRITVIPSLCYFYDLWYKSFLLEI